MNTKSHDDKAVPDTTHDSAPVDSVSARLDAIEARSDRGARATRRVTSPRSRSRWRLLGSSS